MPLLSKLDHMDCEINFYFLFLIKIESLSKLLLLGNILKHGIEPKVKCAKPVCGFVQKKHTWDEIFMIIKKEIDLKWQWLNLLYFFL